MAFTLSTIYKAVDKFSPILKQMERANSSFAAKQDKAWRQMGNSIVSVRNHLLGLAGNLSVASLLFMGSKAVVDYDDALQSLSAITGVTGKQFENFKKEIIDVATKTKKSAVDVAKAFELVGSAQPELLKDAKALAKVSEAAIILSKASRDDLANSALNVTGVLNQFSLGADQATRAINVLSAGNVVGAATIMEVTQSMKNVGAVASTANASLEETVALIEVLGKFQLKGEEAGTKLRGVFIKLQQAGMGYASGQFKINDALVEAKKKIDSLSTAKQKDAAILKIFGLENITAGKILMNNTKLFEEYTKGVTGTNSAYEMAATNSASFASKLQQLKARFENIIISGNENSKTLTKLGKVIDYVTNNLDKIIAVVGTAIVLFASYYTLMTTIRIATTAYNIALGIFYATQASVPIALGASTVAINAYNVAMKIGSIATWLFSAALWACPITWIIAGIIALGVGIFLLVKNWDKVSAAMKRFFDWAWTGIKKFGRMILDVMLAPLVLVLKAIEKLTGAKWAESALGDIENLKDKVYSDDVKPVNIQKSSNDAQTSRYEEITNNKLQIELNNKSDKKANVVFNPAMIPVTTNTH